MVLPLWRFEEQGTSLSCEFAFLRHVRDCVQLFNLSALKISTSVDRKINLFLQKQ